jgi:putative endonuclease
MYYIYILYSKVADKFYVGHSRDPWKRLEQHNANRIDKYTGKYSNWELKAVFEISPFKGEANKFEKFIKRQKSKLLLLKLIDENFIVSDKLKKLVRVPHLRD